MSHSAPASSAAAPREEPEAPAPTVPEAFQTTPNAERYVLQADALRRRQLRAALLYGSSRYWRRRQRVWPSIIIGTILAAVLAGIIVVIGAFEAQQDINQERQQPNTNDPSTPLTPQEPAAGHQDDPP